MQSTFRAAFAIIVVAALLAACGGDDHVDANGGGTTARTTDLPDSALQSSAGLVAYLNDLIANSTNSTAEPILVGDAVLPTSDTTEPVGIN